MDAKRFFVVSGFGDSCSPSTCWDCKLVKEFFEKSDAVRFAEEHYDFLTDEIMTTCNAHWYKSIFVEVVGASKVSKFVKGVK